MSNSYKLIVFDWDGTLMDSADRIVSSFRNAMRDVGLPILDEERIRSIIGLGLPEAIAALYPEHGPDTRQRLAAGYSQYYMGLDPTPIRPFDGAEALLAELAERGFWLAVATGKSRRGLDRVLAETGFGRYFFATRCAEETASKPDPLMLRELMFEADAVPAATLMIGDTRFDLDMARHAHVPSIGIAHGVHGREELVACEPLGVLDDLIQLHAWLDRADLDPASRTLQEGTCQTHQEVNA
ncbi:MAG: HAD-IA family hydrolase [Pseudomonadota bacterium]